MKEHFIKVNLTNGYKQKTAVVAISSEATCSFFYLFNQILNTSNQPNLFNVFQVEKFLSYVL